MTIRCWILGVLAALGVGLVPSSAAASVTSTTTLPYATSFPTCSGGSVYLSGVVHILERDGESQVAYNYRLTGSNEATGERYRFNATIIDTFVGSSDEGTFTHTFVRKVTLVGSGGAESVSGMALVHVTAVDGEVTTSIERIEPLC